MRTAVVTAAIAAVVAFILLIGAGDATGPNAFIVIGVSTGCVYGLFAVGLVLVYKGSRVFNFAQAEFGTTAAFILFILTEQNLRLRIPFTDTVLFETNANVNYALAMLIAVAFVVLVGLAMERVVIRPLLEAPRITVLVATIAFALLSIGVQILLFLPEAKALDPAIPGLDAEGNPRGVELFNFILEPQGILVIGVLIAFAAIGAYFFSKTDLGLAVLATSQDAFATRVVGIGVERTSRFIWGSAAFLGAIAGILFVPLAGVLAPGSVTTGLLIPGFTAAVLGGMTSLPGAFVGGVAVGIISRVSEWAGGHYYLGEDLLGSVVPGFENVALVAALLIVLLVRPAGLLGTEA